MARFSESRLVYALLLWLRPQIDSLTLPQHLTRFAFFLIGFFAFLTVVDTSAGFSLFLPSLLLTFWILALNSEEFGAKEDEAFGQFFHAHLCAGPTEALEAPGRLHRGDVRTAFEPIANEEEEVLQAPFKVRVRDNFLAWKKTTNYVWQEWKAKTAQFLSTTYPFNELKSVRDL